MRSLLKATVFLLLLCTLLYANSCKSNYSNSSKRNAVKTLCETFIHAYQIKDTALLQHIIAKNDSTQLLFFTSRQQHYNSDTFYQTITQHFNAISNLAIAVDEITISLSPNQNIGYFIIIADINGDMEGFEKKFHHIRISGTCEYISTENEWKITQLHLSQAISK